MKTQIEAGNLARNLAAIMVGIQAVDLEPIMVKLMDSDEGEGWSLEKTREIETWYRQFLCLNALYPDRAIVPTRDIDTFWHYHILDTKKYAEDCEVMFGYFLHHFPYFGMRGDQDRQNLHEASSQTWQLFREHFGESPVAEAASKCASECTGTSCSHCQGSTCQSVGDEKPRLAVGLAA